MPLKDIFCQDKTIADLERAYATNKVAHAFIFAGHEGVGKFTAAKEFAKLLLCKNPVKENDFADSCGDCVSCRAFEAGSHPDFEHVYKELLEFTEDGKGKDSPVDFPIDVVREFLIKKVSGKPTLSARKVFILSEVEKLNNVSQNCLLKVLEEPPGYCCIILTCTRPDKLLPTIRSRCQILRFGPIAEDKIIEKLNGLGLHEKQAKFFARLSDGSMGLGCACARLELAEANLYQIKTKIVNALAEFEYQDSLETAEKCQQWAKSLATAWAKLEPATSRTDINRKAAGAIVQIVIGALHDVMLAGVTPHQQLINFDQPEQIKKIARRFNAEQAGQKIADCFKTLHWIESSVNERLIFESLLLNLAESDKITSEL
ncbi:MAG: DNA polymerase III subunit delta' [Sedimentisphaerales bacterium]|jgi:DNA polymerase-3 subunit delta'